MSAIGPVLILALVKHIEVAFTKPVRERYSEIAHVPATVRILVKIFGVIDLAPAIAVKYVVDREGYTCSLVFQELFFQRKI